MESHDCSQRLAKAQGESRTGNTKRSFRLITKERNEIIPVLALFQAPERHLGTRDVFLRVFEIFKLFKEVSEETRRNGKRKDQCREKTHNLRTIVNVTYQRILFPCDCLVLVCVRVGEAFHLAGFTTKETVKVWPNLIPFFRFEIMALLTPCLLQNQQRATRDPGNVVQRMKEPPVDHRGM